MNSTILLENTTIGGSFTRTKSYLLCTESKKIFTSVYLPSFIYTFIMFLICCPGNALVIYVYGFRWRRNTTRIFIGALALFDLINGMVTTPIELAIIWNVFRWENDWLCKFSRFMTFTLNDSSSLTLLGIAYDRYKRICHPLRLPMTTKTAKYLILIGLICSVVFSWPALVLYGVQTTKFSVTNNSQDIYCTQCLIADAFVPTKFPLIFTTVLLVATLIIDIVLIILYSSIALKLKRHRTLDRPMSVENVEDKRVRLTKTTVMSFFVTLLSIVSFVPYCTIVIIRGINPGFYLSLSSWEKSVVQVLVRSYLLSMSLNPVIYSLVNKQFRDECRQLWTGGCDNCRRTMPGRAITASMNSLTLI